MMIGNALTPWPMRPATVVVGLVRVPPNFLQLWMNLIFFPSTTSMMLSGSSVIALILSIFEFSVAMAPMNAPKCLLAASVSFMVRRCACQLLLGVCQLTFGMFTFTFYELESSSRRSIRSGMREARKRNCEGKHCCCCSHPPKTFFAGGGETPLAKSSNAFSDSHPSWERRKAQCEKRGGKGSSPTAHSQFRLLHPLLTSQTTKEVRYQELRARRRSSTIGCKI